MSHLIVVVKSWHSPFLGERGNIFFIFRRNGANTGSGGSGKAGRRTGRGIIQGQLERGRGGGIFSKFGIHGGHGKCGCRPFAKKPIYIAQGIGASQPPATPLPLDRLFFLGCAQARQMTRSLIFEFFTKECKLVEKEGVKLKNIGFTRRSRCLVECRSYSHGWQSGGSAPTAILLISLTRL
jgi:hypothetical protein